MTLINFENGRIRFFSGKAGTGEECCTCCWGCRAGVVPSLTVYGAKGGTEFHQFPAIPFSNGEALLPIEIIGDQQGDPDDTYLVRSAECFSVNINSFRAPYHPYLTFYSIFLQKIIIQQFGTSGLFTCQIGFSSGTSIDNGLGQILVVVSVSLITPQNYDDWENGLQPFIDTVSQHSKLFDCEDYFPLPLPAFDTNDMTLDFCTTDGVADDPCPVRVVFNPVSA